MPDTSMLIFDLDGTLVDTRGDIVRVVNDVLVEMGAEAMTPAEVMSHVGRGTPYLLAKVLGREPDDGEVVEARRMFVDLYSRDPARDSHLYPGVVETLDAVAGKMALAVVSNKAGSLVRATLEAVDLERYFEPAWGGDEVGAIKPAPDGLLAAMTLRGANPGETIMVGDMDLDMRAGRAAGTRILFVSYGFGKLGPEDPTPDGVIDGFDQLGRWI